MACFLNVGMQYTSFSQIFVPICSLEESTLVAGSQWQSADIGQSELTDFAENCVVYDGHRLIFFYESVQLEDIKHVWFFELILEHIVFICHAFPSNEAHVCASLLCSEWLESLFLSCLVHDAQFLFETIYKVCKCMMPSVCKSVQI